jgi:hypothetical protein
MNTFLYIGIALIVSIFILFILYQMKLRQLDIEEFKQQQLTKSFNANKYPKNTPQIQKGKSKISLT